MTDLAMRDTIAALATSPGQAGIAIVRISGPDAEKALRALFIPYQKNCPYEDRRLYLGRLMANGQEIDECMAVLMRGPKSYTRQDVAELQLHGGEWAAGAALNALYTQGVRAAEPGEFTLRAYLNGRVDLSGAEAVMRLIGAEGERAARAALRQLNGGASQFITQIQQTLLQMISSLEAAIDYPDEIEESETAADLAAGARALAQTLEKAADERSAHLLSEGLNVALLGRPNAGKSTLLNALLGEERAIVTDVPGTTRDIIRGVIYLNGLKINLLDTAGLRNGGDKVEQIGVERALNAAKNADLALVLADINGGQAQDAQALFSSIQTKDKLLVLTKADLGGEETPIPSGALRISAKTGAGLDSLKAQLAAFAAGVGDSPLTMRRHIDLALKARSSLLSAAAAFENGSPLEFGAVDLHEALNALSSITGDRVDEKLLDDIFSRFCVGK